MRTLRPAVYFASRPRFVRGGVRRVPRRMRLPSTGRAALAYMQGSLRQAVLRLKFSAGRKAGRAFGGVAGDHLGFVTAGRAGLTHPSSSPFPCTRRAGASEALINRNCWRRDWRERCGGSARGGAQVAKACLRRKRATPPQTGLSVAARRENLRGRVRGGRTRCDSRTQDRAG